MTSAPPGGAIRVLIADDDPLLRAGLRMMLASADDVEVVAEADNGTQVLHLVDLYAPDVVLMDIRMPAMDGLAATEAVRSRRDAPEVVILTTFDADEHVLRALRAGAAGFVLKDTPPHDILAALRRVVSGEPVLSPAVTRRLIARAAWSAQDARYRRAREQLARLSEREREIAAEVGAGKSNMQIGAALFLSVPTVKKHVSHILTTLDLNNRVQIALLVHDADLGGGPDADLYPVQPQSGLELPRGETILEYRLNWQTEPRQAEGAVSALTAVHSVLMSGGSALGMTCTDKVRDL